MKLPVVALVIAVVLLPAPVALTQDSRENADYKLALNLYNDGLYDLAAEQLKQFISLFPMTAQGIEARFYLGLAQLKLKQFDDARLSFQTFALTYQDNPRAAEAWWNVGESYAAVRNYREAALAYERVKVFHPKSKLAPDALARAGRYFLQANERDNARRVLRIVLQEYPSSAALVDARTLLGRIYFEDGNLEQAQNELKRVVDGDPSPDARAQALLILGNIAQAMQKPDQAQGHYQEIIEKYKNSSAVQGAYLNLARLQSMTGSHAAAAENYRKALAVKGSIDSLLARDAMAGLGDATAAVADHAGAVTAYERFLGAYPQDQRVPDVLWKMAQVAARGKNYAKSNEAANRLLRSNGPERLKRRAAAQLARNAAAQKNAPLAAQLFQAFIEQYPEDASSPAIAFRLAELYEKELRDMRKAATAYENVASKFQRSPFADDGLLGAARCSEKLREFDRALQLYNELIQRYPASDGRPEAEERIRTINAFEVKDKDAGLEKLALLVGDVVAEKDRIGLSYRLGEIYFNDLKNYGAASAQFNSAINSGMTDERFVNALYMRSRSYDYLAMKDESYRGRAIESYQLFLRSYPSDPRSEEAVLSLFRLNARSLADARSAYMQAMATYPRFRYADTLLLQIGGFQEKSDSTEGALETYSQLLASSAHPGVAAEAGYRTVQLLLKLGLADTAFSRGAALVASGDAGAHTAALLGQLGDLAMRQNQPEQAVRFYQQLANEFPYTNEGSTARRRLADAYVAAGMHGEALGIYMDLINQQANSALADDGPEPSLLLALGTAQHVAGNNREAKDILSEVLARERTGRVAGQALTVLGLIYKAEGSMELAATCFRQAEKAAPGVAATREIAGLLYDSGNVADAASQYAQLIKNTEDEQERQFYEARVILCHLKMDNLSQAEKEFDAFRKKYDGIDEYAAAYELERGLVFYRKEEYGAALKILTGVAGDNEDSPSAPPAVYWIGKSLQATGKVPEAIREFERLLDRYPTAPIASRAHLALGNIYYTGEKYGDAIKHYRVVVDDPSADPSLLPFAMNNLIETYEVAGINDAALALTRRYLELFPNSEDAFDKRIKIGILYGRLGYHDQAVLHLQGLLDEAGSDLEGELRYYIAEANYNKGDYQQAILDFLKVPYLVTKKGKIDWTANALYMSGQSYEKMGRYDQAITMYQQIVDRTGIDETFKTAARKEIDRVRLVLKKK